MTAKAVPVTLLHGWGIDSTIWQPLVQRLKPAFAPLSLDLPGYGTRQAMHDDWTLDSLATDVLAHAPQHSILIGWSLGGLLALYIAAHYPTDIRAVMTLASSPAFVQREHWPWAMEQASFHAFKQHCQDDPESCLRQFKRLISHGADKDTIRGVQRLDCQIAPHALAKGLELLELGDLRAQLPSVQRPVVHLLAQHDALIPASLGVPLAQLSPQAKVHIIDGASHALPFSHSQVIVSHLEGLTHAA